MIRLLKTGLFRLKKEVLFWLFIFLTIGLAGYGLIKCSSVESVSFDNVVNEFIMYIGLFIAIFVSIFVGKEYSQGIIRNKIIVGHSRISIFLSNLIISIAVSILCEAIYLVIVISLGTYLFGQLQITSSQFLLSMVDTILIIISFCSIFNFVTMICSDITVSTAICMVLFIAMFIAQAALSLTAFSTKYSTNTTFDENGEIITIQEPDPNYPGDEKVKQARILYLLIPQGQAMEVGSDDFEVLSQMPIYSIIVISIVNFLGIYIFCKKDLK